MNFSKDIGVEEDSIDINVTSLVDIVFNLMLFFMLTTTFSGGIGIKVNLPKASSGTAENTAKDVTVTIDAQGNIFVGDKVQSVDSLRQVFEEQLHQGNRSSLVLRADAQVNHGLVVRVMDAAKEAGIEKLAIATLVKE